MGIFAVVLLSVLIWAFISWAFSPNLPNPDKNPNYYR